jgi:hypothetical protein
MKDNVHIKNHKYDPEDILYIAEMTYTEMVENGSWNSPSIVQQLWFCYELYLLELWRKMP